MKKNLCLIVLVLILGLLSSPFSISYAYDDVTQVVLTYEGNSIGSPLREGARTLELELLNYPIDRIEVRWRAKRGQSAEGWLFVDKKEYDWERVIEDSWRVETWDSVLSGFTFQIGIARDDNEDMDTQVDIDWIKVYYNPPK
ncbi:MAG: hypothetical protein HYY62_03400 [Deltaproteobacteria bacterium]|nr:hypothetical protein [Deltaproteobacteria bacterium]